ncbi:MAG: hypothetical protein NC115_12120 [Bacteroidales bacterium]|nr:hypothetical protein [Bacteroidales bacterium]
MEKTIIDTYERLPIGRYLEIARISADAKLDDVDRQVGIVSVLSGMETDDVLALDLATFADMSLRSTFLNREAKPAKVASSYRLGSLELVRVKDFRFLTAGQYIDFQQYCRNGGGLVDLLSVLLIPAGHKYNDGYDMDKVRDVISEHLSLCDALALQDFFFQSSKKLIASSLSCWEEEIRKMSRTKRREKLKELTALRDSLQGGDGSPLLMLSATQHGRTGTRSSRWQPWSSFKSWLTGKKRTSTN